MCVQTRRPNTRQVGLNKATVLAGRDGLTSDEPGPIFVPSVLFPTYGYKEIIFRLKDDLPQRLGRLVHSEKNAWIGFKEKGIRHQQEGN